MSLNTAFNTLGLVFENPKHYAKWKKEKIACLPKYMLPMFNKDIAFFEKN